LVNILFDRLCFFSRIQKSSYKTISAILNYCLACGYFSVPDECYIPINRRLSLLWKMIHLQIITPEKIVFDDEVDQVTLPTTTGEITVLPNHIPLITAIEPGELVYKKLQKYTRMAAGFGFAQISAQNAKILVDLAAPEEELEEKAIEEAKKRAEEALKQKHLLSEEEYATAAANLQKALVQLKVKRRHRRL